MTKASLYLVGTPIGNLGDISQRTRQVLSECDIILAEDTRVSVNLLRHLGIRKDMLSCHNFNEEDRAKSLEQWFSEGKNIAVVSDAGLPLVSDPGYKLVRRAVELGFLIVPVAGPSAPLLALIASGLPCSRFAFEGFLPEKNKERIQRLQKIKNDDRTLIFFVAPSNLENTLADMLQVLGDRPACLAREITKLYEEFLRHNLSTLLEVCRTRSLKGEFVLVVKGQDDQPSEISEAEMRLLIKNMLESGGRLKDVAAILAAEHGWTSSRVYKLALSEREE